MACELNRATALLSRADSTEKPGVDGEAAIPPLKKSVEIAVFGRVRGPADR